MKPPTAFGRRLPPNDWEGDDFTPGAGGGFVTCTDTAAGRAIYWATNGRKNVDGRAIRAAIPGHPAGGLTLPQVAVGVRAVSGLALVIPIWDYPALLRHLRSGGGAIVQGHYSAVPRAYRYQAFADFDHAMWFSHVSPTSGARLWDPLNPGTHAYGRWVPVSILAAFATSFGHVSAAYIPLQPL